MLYPLSYEGIDEMVSHGGYHVVENPAYDQRDQRDAWQREHDQQAEATHHDYLLVVHVYPPFKSGEKDGRPDTGASVSWDEFVILLLVVDLLAREDDVRVGNTVLVGKADVVTTPTDLLCDARQRVTGLDDIAAVTGGLHA